MFKHCDHYKTRKAKCSYSSNLDRKENIIFAQKNNPCMYLNFSHKDTCTKYTKIETVAQQITT